MVRHDRQRHASMKGRRILRPNVTVDSHALVTDQLQ